VAPILKLEKGAEYILHLSAMDVNHGFSLLR
jgi:heme/copper-type cytochrome/quinol oxidase subunit 2